MKKKRLDEKGVMESENGPMTFANDFTACTLSYKLHIWLERYSASASTWLAFGALWSGWDGCDGWMGLTPYTWVTIVAPAVLKNHVYLGHCAAHSEESSNGEEGNALDSQPQLLNRGLVLQQVMQLYVINLSFPFLTVMWSLRYFLTLRRFSGLPIRYSSELHLPITNRELREDK